MSSKVPCYLRTLRREWSLTQEELAGLLPRGGRARISTVERVRRPPNAMELLAYLVIFGMPPQAMFRQFASEVEEGVIQRAYELHTKLEDNESPKALRKKELIRQMLSRAASQANPILEKHE